MKTILLNENTARAFRVMDPFETLDRMSTYGCLAYGMVAEYNDEDEPVGLMVNTVEEDRLVIHWLFVDEEYRGHGIGSYLLMLAFEEADRMNLSQVAVRISDEYDMGDPDWDSWGFFVNDIFKNVEEDEFVWRSSMKELEKLLSHDSAKNKKSAKSNGVFPIKALSAQDRNEAIKSLNKHFSMNIDVPVWELFFNSDPTISFIRKSSDDYVGIVSSRKKNRTLYVAEVYTVDEVDEETLFRAVLSSSEDSFRLTDNIEINIKKRSIERLMDEMKMPGKKYNIEYLTADVSDYRNMKKETPINFNTGR